MVKKKKKKNLVGSVEFSEHFQVNQGKQNMMQIQ